MPEPVLRLRSERRRARRSSHWRWPVVLIGGAGALVWGAACWAPVTPAPLNPVAPTAGVARPAATAARAATPAAAATVSTQAPRAQATPTVVPSPTLGPGGQALLASVRSDLTAQWLKNHSETLLRSGPSDDATSFTTLPQWTLLKQIDSRPDWLEVYYSGDGDTRQPGPGWVRAADVGSVQAPTVWLATAQPTALFSGPDASAARRLDLPPSTNLEVLGLPSGQGTGTRLNVRLPGDGRQVPPSEGWIELGAVARAGSPGVLPWAYPAVLSASVRMAVPYRTQLDGSPYAGANCGPTVLGMVLEAFGRNIEPTSLRDQVLDAEDFARWDDDAGSYIWALARVAEANGVHTYGLYDDASEQHFHRWTTDEIRESVAHGRPVVVQVWYRGLPKRADAAYAGDHYIVVTGLLGDQFLYNDPIGGPVEGPGWDRVMTPAQLQRAMNASDTPFAHTAFAVARG